MGNKSCKTIKELVFDIIHQTKGSVDYETIAEYVRKYFPKSKWKPSHWAWYCSQIKNGKFKSQFSKEEKKNLNIGVPVKPIKLNLSKATPKEENHVKRIGDAILNHVRFMINETAKEDTDLRFKLNRWVYTRLQQEEIRKKRPIKQKLWDSGIHSCQSCGKEFKTIKGVEIHRKDLSTGYSVTNCELLCRSCHQATY